MPPLGPPVDETDQFAWALIAARFNRRDFEVAVAAYARYKPAITSPRHARAWLMLQRSGQWTIDGVEIAIAIAERWPEQEQIVSHVIATVLMETALDGPGRLELTDSLLQRLATVRTRYHADFPDGALQEVEFDLHEFVSDMERRLEPAALLAARIEAKVRDHELPVGLLASAARRPYALAVLTRPAGITPAGTPFENDYDVELEVALSAIEAGTVVCETSALYITILLSEHWDAIRGQFDRLVLPIASYDDIVRTIDELVVPSAGTFAYDPAAGRLVVHAPAPDSLALLRERAAALEARARGLERVAVGELTALPGPHSAFDAPWLAPLQVALDSGLCLYSDDVALRRTAQALGVRAFGTLALLHALVDRGEIEDVTDGVIRSLAREYVVDLPVPVDLLFELAAADDWAPGPATTIIGRPRWWADTHDAVSDFLDIARRVESDHPEMLEHWVFAAAIGCTGHRPAAEQSHVLAMLASLTIVRVTGLEGEPFRRVVRAAQAGARSGSCEDPTGAMIAGLYAAVAAVEDREASDPEIRRRVDAAFAEIDSG